MNRFRRRISAPLRALNTSSPAFVIGCSVFVVTFAYRFGNAAKLTNDHFMHVVWGRQVLMGRSPLRDMVTLGMPLQGALSAWAESIIGYRLLSEALVISTAFALGALLTFHLARRISGNTWLGLVAAVLQVTITPPTYSYPKILVYAVGILALWRYIDLPSKGRAAQVAGAVVVAFYLRHDHGLYLGVVSCAVLLLRHRADWRVAASRLAVIAGIGVATVGPYLVYVHKSGGIRPWWVTLSQFAQREFQANPYAWPSWPLRSPGDVVRWASEDDDAAAINVRWNPSSSEEVRRRAATRYHLRVPAEEPLESGTFVLTDLSRDNVLNLLRDPVVEDTAGVDRRTGRVRVPGLRFWRLRLLGGLDSAAASAAILFFAFVAVVPTGLVLLAIDERRQHPADQARRLKVAAVVLMAVTSVGALVREPLQSRIGDASVAPAVLSAWLAGLWVGRENDRSGHRLMRSLTAAAILAVVARSVFVVGDVANRLERLGADRALFQRLSSSPPFDAWQAVGSAEYRIVRYVRTCTAPREPLLVLWFSPELYYYADRPFAGRFGFYIKGYWSSEEEQRRNIETLKRDQPALAIIEAGRERVDLPSHPEVLAFLNEFYAPVGELPTTDGTILRVFGRRNRHAETTDPDLGWPCYRTPPDAPPASVS